MKRTAIVMTVLLIMLSSTMGVFADTGQKDIAVILSDAHMIVNVGDSVVLTAAVPKQGSAYADSWVNAAKISTQLDPETESYISKAHFSAEKPGVYNIRYQIHMAAGNSSTVFCKTVEQTIEVRSSKTLIGAVVQDLQVTPIYKSDGSISYYSAYCTTHALWSDNTTSENGALFFFFGPYETTKEIKVTLNVDGRQYDYMVTVDR